MNHTTTIPLLLLRSPVDREKLERHLAEMLYGLAQALRDRLVSISEAEEQVFNFDTYSEAKRLRLHPKLIEAMQWGMELDEVAALAPEGLDESYEAISRLSRAVLQRRD